MGNFRDRNKVTVLFAKPSPPPNLSCHAQKHDGLTLEECKVRCNSLGVDKFYCLRCIYSGWHSICPNLGDPSRRNTTTSNFNTALKQSIYEVEVCPCSKLQWTKNLHSYLQKLRRLFALFKTERTRTFLHPANLVRRLLLDHPHFFSLRD